MIEATLIAMTDHSAALAIVILAGLIRQLSNNVARMDKSLDDVKDGCVWQDEFKQFEKRFDRVERNQNGGGK